jgi:WhiB family redox-sensing transcriptional regulator
MATEHGKYSGYTGGCRCDLCRAAGKAYNRDRYQQRQARKSPVRDVYKPASYNEGDTDWLQHRGCKGVDIAVFFPGRGDLKSVAAAKAICATCLVRQDCLDYAIRTSQRIGIWGGLSEYERRDIRSRAS